MNFTLRAVVGNNETLIPATWLEGKYRGAGGMVTQYDVTFESGGHANQTGDAISPGQADFAYRATWLGDSLESLFESVYDEDSQELRLSANETINLAPGDPPGNITNNWRSFFWDFGDGSNSTAMEVSHTYGSNGVFRLSVVVTYDWLNTKTVVIYARVW